MCILMKCPSVKWLKITRGWLAFNVCIIPIYSKIICVGMYMQLWSVTLVPGIRVIHQWKGPIVWPGKVLPGDCMLGY